jgi:hypothetical protein
MFFSGTALRFSAAALADLAASALVPALAHDAPKGWSYPVSCCSGFDCREVSAADISEKPEGYVVGKTGEVVAFSDRRLKNSPDGEFHWCSVAGAMTAAPSACSFRRSHTDLAGLRNRVVMAPDHLHACRQAAEEREAAWR